MEKFIRIEENTNRVIFTHQAPFDEQNGMRMTRDQLLSAGQLVDEIPEPEVREGMMPIMMYTPETNSIYYEYEAVPLSETDRIALLEAAFNEMLMGGAQ